MPPIRRRGDRAWSTRIAPAAAALSLALTVQACSAASASAPPPAAAAAAAGSAKAGGLNSRFFGMHVPTLATSYPLELARTVGSVNLTANRVYWPDLQPAGSAPPDFTRLDTLVDNARAKGAKPLLVLGLTPSWAGASSAAPPRMAAWQDYVRAVVKRYRAQIDYEIWPEPNIKSNWTGSPKQLVSRVIAAAKIIHHVERNALVVSPAMVLRMRYQRTFMDKFFAAKVDGKRVGAFIDAVGVDLYPKESDSPEDSMALLRKARSILHSHRVKAPIWNVEINYGVKGGGQTITRHSSAKKQASYVARTYLLNAAAKVKRVYWLGWGSYDTMDVTMTTSTGTPTKAGRAYLVVAGWLAGQKSRGCAVNKKRHLYTCKLVRSGRTSWAYWTTKGKATVRAPKGSRHVATVTGEVTRTHARKRLTVTTSPIRVYH